MKYFIAGGGDYGSMYLNKLKSATKMKKISVEEIVVIDKNKLTSHC